MNDGTPLPRKRPKRDYPIARGVAPPPGWRGTVGTFHAFPNERRATNAPATHAPVAGAFSDSPQHASAENAPAPPAEPILRPPLIPARSKTGRVILLAIGVLVLAVSVRAGYELSRIAKPQHVAAEAPRAETPPTPVGSVTPEPAKPPAPEREPAKTQEPAVVAAVKPPPKPEPRPPEPSRPAPTFAKDVQPIVTAKCVTCHGRDNKKKGGLDLRSLAALHNGGESGQVVVGGQLDRSPLWESVDSGTMPPGKVKLTSAEKDTLRRWIEAGAK